MKENPGYYFTNQGYGTRYAYYRVKGALLNCKVYYQKKANTWEVSTYSRNYYGGFSVKDNEKIDSIENLIIALNNTPGGDIDMFVNPGCLYKWSDEKHEYVRKPKIVLRIRKEE